ncbi:porin [Sulfitobacter mediterraneus]|uniref:Porin domain-containing protein n=1 Tax=Sulfitobacter mediterraneus TaxID=83219 RepID=A0A061SP70_9RHOB|nr:porin [Sulfitobacter mediterraneus]KAJ02642.1 hypothetical protein PM02_12765 [Sulfitobacter mediterraneus]
MQQIPDHNALAAIGQHPNEARPKLRVRGLRAATALAFLASTGLARAGEAEQSTFEFYGQLNFGIFHVDDGQGNDTYLTDNDNSNSRIGIIHQTELANGHRLKFHFESGLGFSGSAAATLDDNDLGLKWRRTELRKLEVVYSTPTYGRLSFGQGSTGTDGVAETDFSGTSVVHYSSINALAGSAEFHTVSGAGSGTTINAAFRNFDGARRFRLRYDSAPYNGFGLAISAGEEVLRHGDDRDYYDLALRYDRDLDQFKVSGRIGYAWAGSDRSTVASSIAVFHKATGLNLAFATGRQQETGADYAYLKLGLKRRWIDMGETAVSFDLFKGDDLVGIGSQSTSYGLGIVQKWDRYDTELYAGYRNYELTGASVAVADIDVAVIGARWKF